MREDLVRPGERLDDLQLKGYQLIQDPESFCFGMDAVLLSHFANVNAKDRVLDLCTGNGIIPVLVEGLYDAKEIVGLDIQEASVDLATRSAEYNGLQERLHFINGDLKRVTEYVDANSFSVVTVNPPYMEAGNALVNEADAKTIARHEVCATLEDVIVAADKALKVSGRFYMVHRPNRLVDIITLMSAHHLEPKRVRFVQTYANKDPNLVLIEGKKCAGREMKVERPLIIYGDDGEYTEELKEIYGMK